MEAKVYNKEGKEAGKVTLPKEVFELSWNADLVHQVVLAQQSNARTPVAHAADRSEQRGGGRKPWRQKGTGRARHGSRRSPIWRGGGVTHGPNKEKSYKKTVTKKMKAKALYVALSKKLADGEILFVDSLNIEKPSAKEGKSILEKLGGIKGFGELSTKKTNAALIGISENCIPTKKSFSNFGNIEVEEVRNLNPTDVLKHKYLVITDPKKAVETISSRLK